MKKLLTLALSTLLVCALVAPAMASAFPDVPENHWAYKAVEELYAAGLIIGYPDGTFGGQRSMTRYEYAMIVSRLLDRLEEIAAEGKIQADKALKAAENAKDMALKAQLAADAAANAQPVERIIEKHIIETKPDIPYEEVAKQAKDLAVLVEALKEEFSAELAQLRADVDDLDRRVSTVEDRIVRLQERQTKTEEDVAELKALHEKFSVGGTFEVNFKDVNINGSTVIDPDNNPGVYIDPYATDYDDDDLTWEVNKDSDDVYEQGATLESALTLNMAMKPAEGIDATAKVKVKDNFTGSDSAGTSFSLADLALTVTSDGTVKRAYYGNISGDDAFAGYSGFIGTRKFLVDKYGVTSVEGAQVDLEKGAASGQIAVFGNKADDTYYILSRCEYAVNPALTVGTSFVKEATSSTTEPQGLQRYGGYAKGSVSGIDYNVGFYKDDADKSAYEVSLARTFGPVDVAVDYDYDYAENTYTLLSAETVEGFTLGSLPFSIYGEFGTTDAANENHFKAGAKIEDYKLGLLNVGAGVEMVSKATETNEYGIATWDDNDIDYNKFSLDAGFDMNLDAVKLSPGVEYFVKDVTENDAGLENHTDNRLTLKVGFESTLFTKGTLTGTFKHIIDKGYNNEVVESKASGLDFNYAYPVGAVDLT
ncbi:MAG: S-layer homology domain-containing protein, partial [Firmicutes bacterium]|nr:S-layer homology domain-containing protein [Bacillota bacterium]